MVALYVGGQKVEWADAEKVLSAASVDFNTGEIRSEDRQTVMQFVSVDRDAEPLIVDEQNRWASLQSSVHPLTGGTTPEPLGFALVGCRIIARIHVKAVQEIPGARVVALVSRTKASAKKLLADTGLSPCRVFASGCRTTNF